MIPIHAEQINQLLPQTQCRECGFSGCLPYAQALAQGETTTNLCSAGGETVAQDLADLLGVAYQSPVKIQAKVLAWIDETVCIGCTACIRACPVDAIMGASKYMHTVLADECTGCGLCVAPCPVDCIHLQPVADAFYRAIAIWQTKMPTKRAFRQPATPKRVTNGTPNAKPAMTQNAAPKSPNAKPPPNPYNNKTRTTKHIQPSRFDCPSHEKPKHNKHKG